MPQHFKEILLSGDKAFTDSAFEEQLPLLEDEYAQLLDVLGHGGHFDVVNCWDRDNSEGEKCITIGDIETDEDGKIVSMETVLTAEVDQLIENCLDYIFQIDLSENPQAAKFKVSET